VQIWLARNSFIYTGVQPDPLKILKSAKSTIGHHLSAWHSASGVADWVPPPIRSFTVNFDVVIHSSFAMAATTLRDHNGIFIAVNSLKLPSMDVGLGEAHIAFLAVRLTVSFGYSSLVVEGDSLVTMMAINNPHLFFDWNIEPLIFDILLQLHSFPVLKALKILRCANFCAHQVTRWAATNHVFGSILHCSPFISAIRFRSRNDPPL
jgi:hypothetical protein